MLRKLLLAKKHLSTGQYHNLYKDQAVYNEYGVWVYGHPKDDNPGAYSPEVYGQYMSSPAQRWKYNMTTGRKEPLYLGFNSEGRPVSNDDFPNDFKTTSDPTKRNYVETDDAIDSWEEVRIGAYAMNRLLGDFIYNDDGTTGEWEKTDYKANQLINASVYKKFMEYMRAPTEDSVGVFRLWHIVNGILLFDTMQVSRTQEAVSLDTVLTLSEIDIEIPYDYRGSTYQITATVNSPITLSNNNFNGTIYGSMYFIKEFEQMFNGLIAQKQVRSYPMALAGDMIPSNDMKHTFNVSIPVPRPGQRSEYDVYASTRAEKRSGGALKDETAAQTIKIKRLGEKEVDFSIRRGGSSGAVVTDKGVELTDLNFTTAQSLHLQSLSSVVGGSFVHYYWSVKNTSGIWEVFHHGASATTASFPITSANKALYLKNGRVEFKLSAKDSSGSSTESEMHYVDFYKYSPPQPAAQDPVALITGKSSIDTGDAAESDPLEVPAGGRVQLSGRDSYAVEEGAKIVGYTFDVPTAAKVVSDQSHNGRMYITFPKYISNKQYADVRVKDSKGNSQTSDSLTIRVVEPELDLKVSVTGDLKQNRKFTVSLETSEYPTFYPIDTNSIDFTLTPLDGQSSAYFAPSGIDKNMVFDMQVHDYGRYRLDASAEIFSLYDSSANRVSDTDSLIINITEDQDAVIEYSVTEITNRDPKNYNLAKVTLTDLSYSPDGDIVKPRMLYELYDSDDDGFLC